MTGLRLAAPALLLLVASALPAQRAILLVGVGDAETGAFVPGAEVQVKGTGRRAHTDEMGRARLASLPAGQYTVEVRRVGYEPLSAPVLLAERDSTDVVMLMQASVTRLPEVAVHERPMEGGHIAEFETLRATGQGRFVALQDVERQRDYSFNSFLLTNLPSMRVKDFGGAYRVEMVRGMKCQPLVFLDGTLIADGDVSGVSPKSLAAIAWFESGQIPPKYRRGGSGGPLTNVMRTGVPDTLGAKATSMGGDAGCGALVMWQR